MRPVIDSIAIVEELGAPGDDTCFVGLRGAGRVGWYGPVSAAIGRWAQDRLTEAVVGAPFEDHQGLYTALRGVVHADTTPAASWAVGAVDCAAWDLHGRFAQASVADLLTHSPQRRVPLYASWLALDLSIPGTTDSIETISRDGWLFTKWGLRTKPERGLHREAARLAGTAEAVAAMLGQAAAFDAVFTWSATIAEQFASQVDPAVIVWLEDPLSDHDLASYRMLMERMSVAVGERLFVNGDGPALLELRPRALTLDVVACGGLTRAIDLVEEARARGVPVYPHGRSFVPAVHLAAAFPEVVPAVEYRLQWEPARQSRYADPWLPRDGTASIPTAPGLGAAPRSS